MRLFLWRCENKSLPSLNECWGKHRALITRIDKPSRAQLGQFGPYPTLPYHIHFPTLPLPYPTLPLPLPTITFPNHIIPQILHRPFPALTVSYPNVPYPSLPYNALPYNTPTILYPTLPYHTLPLPYPNQSYLLYQTLTYPTLPYPYLYPYPYPTPDTTPTFTLPYPTRGIFGIDYDLRQAPISIQISEVAKDTYKLKIVTSFKGNKSPKMYAFPQNEWIFPSFSIL